MNFRTRPPVPSARKSGFPGYKIPPISKGNAPIPTRGGTSNNLVKGAYVNRGGANNTREMWTRGDDPDQVGAYTRGSDRRSCASCGTRQVHRHLSGCAQGSP